MPILLMVLFLAFPYLAQAGTTYNAASCSANDIDRAIYLATDGDTVSVPSGSCSHGAALTTTNIVSQGGLCKFTIANHGLQTGAWVTVAVASGVSGCGAASLNAPHMVTVIDNNTLTVADSSFSGGYVSGGNLTPRVVLKNKSISVVSAGTTTLTGTPFIGIYNDSGTHTLSFIGFSIVSSTLDTDLGAFRISVPYPSQFRLSRLYVDSGSSHAGTIYASAGVVDNSYFTGSYQKWDVLGTGGGGTQNKGDPQWSQSTSFGSANFAFFEDNTFYSSTTSKAWGVINSQYGGRAVLRHNILTNQGYVQHGAMGVGASYEGRAGRATEIYENIFNCPLETATGNQCYAWLEIIGGAVIAYNNTSTGPWQNGIHLYVQRVQDSNAFGAPWGQCRNYGTTGDTWDGVGISGAPGYPCHDQTGTGPDSGPPNTTPQTITDPGFFWGNIGKTTISSESSANYLVNGRDYCTHSPATPCGGITTAYTAYTYPHPLVNIGGPYTVTASVQYSGTPAGTIDGVTTPVSKVVSAGTTTTFTIAAPASTWTVGGTCGGTLVGGTYTTNAVNSNCTVQVTFWQAVTASPGANGTLTCNSPIQNGYPTTCTASPSGGYHTSGISGCGGTWVSGNYYTTGNIVSDCTVTATFADNTYSVTSSAGSHVTVDPLQVTPVADGGYANFTITVDSGYYVSISTSGGCTGYSVNGTTYSFGPITSNCQFIASALPLSTGGGGKGGVKGKNGKIKVSSGYLKAR